jgi:hypothetical protein
MKLLDFTFKVKYNLVRKVVKTMVKFIPVEPDEIDNLRDGRRGRVSYPILKSFLETGLPLAKLDRTGIQQSLMSLTSSLNAYVRNHELPIKIFQRRGELYLMRLDLDPNGEPRPWDPNSAHGEEEIEADIVEVTEDEVLSRYAEEKGQVTK